jgi:hypothetical protein
MCIHQWILGFVAACVLPAVAQTNLPKQATATAPDDELPMRTVLRDISLYHSQGAILGFSKLKKGDKVQILKVKGKRVKVRYYKNGRAIDDWIDLANGCVEGLQDEEAARQDDPEVRISSESTGTKIDPVEVGMTREQVIGLRGKPGFVSTKGQSESLVYQTSNTARYVETMGHDEFNRPLRRTKTISYKSTRTTITLTNGIVTEVKCETFKPPVLGGGGTLVK